MNRRQIFGWLVSAIGIVLIVISINSMHAFQKQHEQELKHTPTRVKIFFTHNPLWNPVIKFFGGKPQEKLPEHATKAIVTQTVGIALVVVGGVVVYVLRKKIEPKKSIRRKKPR